MGVSSGFPESPKNKGLFRYIRHKGIELVPTHTYLYIFCLVLLRRINFEILLLNAAFESRLFQLVRNRNLQKKKHSMTVCTYISIRNFTLIVKVKAPNFTGANFCDAL